jgi:hypothetical protein
MPDCMSAPFVQRWKKNEISSDGGNSGSKKCYGGVWRSLHVAEVWSREDVFTSTPCSWLVWVAKVIRRSQRW